MHHDSKPTMFSLRRTLLVVIFVFFALGILADVLVNRLLDKQYRLDQELFVTFELSALRARLEERINSNLFLVYGMAANISVRPELSTAEFDALASALLGKSTLLRNLAAAPDFVIRFVSPLAGNEKALGLDYRNLPDQWAQAQAAMQTGRMAVAGPIQLVQGGRGLVARVPVYVGDRFWGLVSSVMDIDKLVREVGLDELSGRLDLAIRGKDGKGPEGDVFWGNPLLFQGMNDAVALPVSLPSGAWQIVAIPREGWSGRSPYQGVVHGSILLLAALGCIVTMQRIRSRQALMESENRMRAMSQASHDPLAMIDAEDNITFWNPAGERVFGYSEAEMLGKKLHDILVLPKERDWAKARLDDFARSGTGPIVGRTMEVTGVRKSGETFPVERGVAAFRLGGKWYAVGSMRDISRRKQDEKRLNELATTDELTGLSNRRHFLEQAEAQLRQALRYKQEFSFMMLDLDHFKRINDTHGHDAGDEVLRAVARTMREVMRGTDIIGRLGGEEFGAVMPETGAEAARQVAERLRLRIMGQPIAVPSGFVRITASIGIAHLGSEQASLSDLMKKADLALYEAKNGGRNRIVIDA